MKKIELLAPAGNPQSLVAAVSAGADAVYLAGSRFGARAFAGNFNDEQLVEYIDYCHLRGVKVYITVNTLIRDEEIDDFVDYCLFLYTVGADALILQDIGMLQLLSSHLPDMELHASTQMTINTASDVIFLKENFNIKRAVVSRELGTDEIRQIKEQSGVEIEAFVHGAICVSYSGKCLFSSLNGGRSANRGMCAQPCREKYFVSGDMKEGDGEYFLSPKDLNTLMDIDRILESGVDSLKIEGRMKRPEYVYAVTNAYRRAIDLYSDGNISSASKNAMLKKLDEDLAKVFNRGFTGGYILGSDKNEIMNSLSQKSIGIEAARVINYDKKKKRLKLLLLDDLVKGDGLSTGEFVGRIIKDNVICLQADKGQTIELDSIKHFDEGTVIYKTFDKLFMDKVEQGIKSDKEIPVRISVSLSDNGTGFIDIRDADGNCVHYEKSSIVEKSVNKSTTSEEVKRQILKLGEYIYAADDAEIDIDSDIYVSAKNLNLLRREGIELLNRKRIDRYKRKPKFIDTDPITKRAEKNNISHEYKNISWSIFVSTKEQLDAIYESYAGEIYIDDEELYKEAIARFDKSRVIYRLAPVIKQSDLSDIEDMTQRIKSRFIASSAGLILTYGERIMELDYHMNLFNSLSHNFFHQKGMSTTISLETDPSKSNELRFVDRPDMIEIPVYLYPQLMITEFCPQSGRGCNKDKCSSRVQIINKNDDSFIFKSSINCKNIIYPKKPMQLEKSDIKRFIEQGFIHFRLELMDEDALEVKRLMDHYINI